MIPAWQLNHYKPRESNICQARWIGVLKIEYHAVGDTWWQPLLSYCK